MALKKLRKAHVQRAKTTQGTASVTTSSVSEETLIEKAATVSKKPVGPPKVHPNTPSVRRKPVVFTFARMNPPTAGHEHLVNKIHEIASKNKAEARVYLSKSHDHKKNPLPYNEKFDLATKAFGDIVKKGHHRDVFDVMKELHQKGHREVHMVVGGDRQHEFHELLHRYNGPTKEYHFSKIHVHSAGVRDPDKDGVTGVSASKMRQHAITGNHAKFKSGLPDALKPHSKEVLMKTRRGMRIQESAMPALERKAEESGHDLSTILAVFERGLDLHENNKVSYLTPNQYAFSRVNSFINEGAAWKQDQDLLEDVDGPVGVSNALKKHGVAHSKVERVKYEGDGVKQQVHGTSTTYRIHTSHKADDVRAALKAEGHVTKTRREGYNAGGKDKHEHDISFFKK